MVADTHSSSSIIAREHTLYILAVLSHSLLTWSMYTVSCMKAKEANKVQALWRVRVASALTRFALNEAHALKRAVFKTWYACMRNREYAGDIVLLQQQLLRLAAKSRVRALAASKRQERSWCTYVELPPRRMACVLGRDSRCRRVALPVPVPRKVLQSLRCLRHVLLRVGRYCIPGSATVCRFIVCGRCTSCGTRKWPYYLNSRA